MPSEDILKVWQESKPLIRQGYKVLHKEVALGMPAVSFPAADNNTDSGIGSPYGQGAKQFCQFFDGVVDKILLTPTGETFPPTFSPYTSTFGYNPFLIPLEKVPFLSEDSLARLYNNSVKGEQINYASVSVNYLLATEEIYNNFLKGKDKKSKNAIAFAKEFADFIKQEKYIAIDADYYHGKDKERYLFMQFLASKLFTQQGLQGMQYIGDLQVKIPDSYVHKYPKLFLSDYTLGVPPDAFSPKPRNWGFPVFNPDEMFTAKNTLGKAGKLLYDIFDNAFKRNKGGLRIDHFIGMVNPFVIPTDERKPAGRLYSSPDNPDLARYCKYSTDEFARIGKDIILKAAGDNGFDASKIYPEDIGNRPEQLDEVLKLLGLGRMLVSQFVESYNPFHIYRLKNAEANDVAVLGTHDMASVQDFFFNMGDEARKNHANQLMQDLRFDYAADLAEPKNLIRMKWAELMACPVARVQAFFTSFTGQKGRFNQPSCPVKWILRCNNDYRDMYFAKLKQGLAYNPFDAVCVGIWARGDDFFHQNEALVKQLRTAEQKLLSRIEA